MIFSPFAADSCKPLRNTPPLHLSFPAFFLLVRYSASSTLLCLPRPRAFQSLHHNTWALIFSPRPTRRSPAAPLAPCLLTVLIFNTSHIHLQPSPRFSAPSIIFRTGSLLAYDNVRGMAIAPRALANAALLITVCTLINCCITSWSPSTSYHSDGSPARFFCGHLWHSDADCWESQESLAHLWWRQPWL